MITASAILPENYWREVWHIECPGDGERFGPSPSSPMKALPDSLDGLLLYECTGCHERVYAGLDKDRRITTRPGLSKTRARRIHDDDPVVAHLSPDPHQ